MANYDNLETKLSEFLKKPLKTTFDSKKSLY